MEVKGDRQAPKERKSRTELVHKETNTVEGGRGVVRPGAGQGFEGSQAGESHV